MTTNHDRDGSRIILSSTQNLSLKHLIVHIRKRQQRMAMPEMISIMNKKQTSPKVASQASSQLKKPSTPAAQKSVAASALAQARKGK
ncbi:MAG: hypothetical protein HZB47_10825 [Nitrosomonadales bacterium]|nr:hypothetical protein [Nitrosomonadales bacterium]